MDNTAQRSEWEEPVAGDKGTVREAQILKGSWDAFLLFALREMKRY